MPLRRRSQPGEPGRSRRSQPAGAGEPPVPSGERSRRDSPSRMAPAGRCRSWIGRGRARRCASSQPRDCSWLALPVVPAELGGLDRDRARAQRGERRPEAPDDLHDAGGGGCVGMQSDAVDVARAVPAPRWNISVMNWCGADPLLAGW